MSAPSPGGERPMLEVHDLHVWQITSGQPSLSDYLGLAFNEAGRLRADTTPESIWGTPEYQCRPHSAPHQWRGLGGARILKEQDPLTREVRTYHVQFMRSLDRPIFMDGRPHPPAWAPHTWTGFSTGEWIGNTLKVTTTHLKDGFLKRGGPQTSDVYSMTEFITRHDEIMTIVTVIDDPIYMDEPYVHSTTYAYDPTASVAHEVCNASTFAENGGTDRHWVPHFLPGTNNAREVTDIRKLEDVVLRQAGPGGAVYLRDVARVRFGHKDRDFAVRTNGVAAIHSQLLRTMTVRDLAEIFPARFSNKTNGVTPRRWLLLANPALAGCITEAIGDGWIIDLAELGRLEPLAGDPSFQAAIRKAKREAKAQFARWLGSTSGVSVDPDSIFDSQVKRIHEYKRQLLNALRIVVLYNRLRQNPDLEMAPRTFFFAGKAAPAYHLAKLIIKFINNLAGTIDGDPAVRDRLKVVFLPEYCVSLAERLIPASDVSNQISTAGYEASGTSNMKFMMNGALTIGTRDGATIEMAEEAGEENFFLFGLTAEQVAASRGWYNPRWHYDNEPETRAALDLIFSDHFSRNQPRVFAPLSDALFDGGDYYMHLADLKSYLEADQRLRDLYADPGAWARKAILNVAGSGKFSSDRTIAEYAAEVWNALPCPIA